MRLQQCSAPHNDDLSSKQVLYRENYLTSLLQRLVVHLQLRSLLLRPIIVARTNSFLVVKLHPFGNSIFEDFSEVAIGILVTSIVTFLGMLLTSHNKVTLLLLY